MRRYLDGGWRDTHTATSVAVWVVDGSPQYHEHLYRSPIKGYWFLHRFWGDWDAGDPVPEHGDLMACRPSYVLHWARRLPHPLHPEARGQLKAAASQGLHRC